MRVGATDGVHVTHAGRVAAARAQRPGQCFGRGGSVRSRADRDQGIEHLPGALRSEEAPGGHELELGPVVAVHDDPPPAREPGGAGVPHHQMSGILLGPVYVQVVPPHRADAWVREQPREPRAVIADRLRRSDDHQIPRRAEPQLGVREHLADVRDDRGHDGQRQLVELHPLAEHTIVREPAAEDAEELRGVQRRHARDPGVAGFRDDDVVARGIHLQGAAGIVHDGRHRGPAEDGVVDPGEEARHLQHSRLDLDDAHASHPGDVGEGAGGHAAPEADHQRGSDVRASRNWGQARQNLGVHVSVVGRIGFAVHLEGAARRALPDRHGGVPTFAEGQLPPARVAQEPAALGGRHLGAPVDGGPEVDEPAAPVRGRERDDEGRRAERAAAQHPQSQAAVLR